MRADITHQRRQIQHHHHPTVAQHGRSGNTRHVVELRADRLDDDFLVAQHGFDLQGGAGLGTAEQQGRRPAILDFLERQHVFATGQDAQIMDRVTALVVLVLDLFARQISLERALLNAGHQFDAEQGNGKDGIAGLGQQCLGNRQRKRQANDETRSLAGFGLDQQGAAHGPNRRVDHVHADATPGNLGDRRGGGKTRTQQQRDQLFLTGWLPRRQKAFFLTLGADCIEIEAGAVVAQFQHQFRAFPMQAQGDGADFGLPDRPALFRCLNAMR